MTSLNVPLHTSIHHDCLVAEPFTDFKHDVSLFRLQGTEEVSEPDQNLNGRKVFQIFTLQTSPPKGMNDEISWMSCFNEVF